MQSVTLPFHFVPTSTGPDGTGAMSLANGLVGTGSNPVCRCKAITPSSISLTSNRVTTNYLIFLTESCAIHFVQMCTGHDGAVAKSSANGLVGTGFASQYRL